MLCFCVSEVLVNTKPLSPSIQREGSSTCKGLPGRKGIVQPEKRGLEPSLESEAKEVRRRKRNRKRRKIDR